jgi:double-strand break repair protein MRE11
LQPGSTTPTSLIEAESLQKHCFLFKISEDEMELERIPLTSTRPFIFRQIELRACGLDPKRQKLVEKYVIRQVSEMIKIAAREYTSTEKLPLIRLKIEHTGF